jgi:RNA recognition motif-containing protein
MSDISSNFSDESLGTPGLTIAQQQEIAAIQSQAALQHMMENNPISTPPECTSLYVGGLDRNVTEKMLYEHFTKVYNLRICRDHVTNANLGYGYLNFSTPEDCKNKPSIVYIQKLIYENRPVYAQPLKLFHYFG